MRPDEAADDAQYKPEQSGPEPVHEHQTQHSFSLSSERNADADFRGSLGHDIGKDAEQADGSQDQRPFAA